MTSSASSSSSFSGRTVLITGGASGIGLATARRMRRLDAHVVLAVRNLEKGRRAAAELGGSTDVRELNLADLASVRRFTDAWDGPIEVLINNAGMTAPTLQRTVDGFESQFGTNYLGPFALTNLLLPQVTGRVVSLSSQAERQAHLDLNDLDWQRRPYKESRAYADSKFANLVFAGELQRRLERAGSTVKSMAAHPGFVSTGIYDQTTGIAARAMVRLLSQDADAGSLPVMMAATADIPGGSFTGPEHLAHMRGGAELIGRSKRAADPQLATALWERSVRLTDASFAL
jgi:NAD(P)-dependent dehydrogenase (short-subunit alcohol dehydrogenase family)